eukprot:Skav201823  [mRNA]  locus=scaffold1071:388890:390242:- [translate_table: standard]
MDMQVGDAGDPLTAYIALTRVQNRHGLFIYRPFAASPFQKGAKVGRQLLLRLWAGENLDWRALRAEKQCQKCLESKPASAFTAGRWKRMDATRVCRECITRHVDACQPWQCMARTAWKQEDAFSARHARPRATFYRVCRTCEKTQLCSSCNARKPEHGFSAAAWARQRNGGRVCLDCSRKAWGRWTCRVCKVKRSASSFATWIWLHGSFKQDQICDACQQDRILQGFVRRRVPATRAKVAWQAAEMKKARAVADVRARIAEVKRKRAEEIAEKSAEVPLAKQQRSDKGADATANEDAQTARKKRKFQYVCPKCQQGVTSCIETGEIDHRSACGRRFRVKNGHVLAKAYAYVCPVCNGSVASNVKTGQVNHETVCGNHFAVLEGVVRQKTYKYICPGCKKTVASNVKTGKVNHRKVCGHEFSVKDGVVQEKRSKLKKKSTHKKKKMRCPKS